MTKIGARETIQKLIEKYEGVLRSGYVKKYTEEETKKDFILPLFTALGWDTENKNEVSAEENLRSGGRVDYGFYVSGISKFYLEAKRFAADLDDPDFAKQAIRYAWNKSVTYSVLTDFENIKLYNAQIVSDTLIHKLIFNISYKDFISEFDKLWFLSKEAFINGDLDKYAESIGKKYKKVSVTDKLSEDFNKSRSILTEEFKTWNKDKASNELIDEGVQKLLNRLVFIKVLEDREIEPPIMMPLLNEWKTAKREKPIPLYQAMILRFRELDKIYNSNIFDEHPFEKWDDVDNATEKVINILYSRSKSSEFEYDFKIMPADVLGAVYENYLGYKLEKSKKESSGKDYKKRKERGIYYTPAYIVDYIVENALGPVLKNCHSLTDLKKIKVLDPACGSGSFLVKTADRILRRYEELDSTLAKDKFRRAMTKAMILGDNLYGVDLDQQAVEICRLNLLINAAEEKQLLPSLSNNIKNGNSLISGTDKELEKYFGKSWRDKKPFNWEEEFPEVFKQGGFDVIIGNPPWGANIDEDSKYLEYAYPNSTKSYKDIYKIFVDKAIQLIKDGGKLGFILPNTFLYQPRYQDIKEIVDKYEYFVINLGERIFAHVQLPSCILILLKFLSPQHSVVDLTREPRELLTSKLETTEIARAIRDSHKVVDVAKKTQLVLDDVLEMKDAGVKHQRVNIGKSLKGDNDLRERIYYKGQIKNQKDHSLLIGSDINRYIQYATPSFFLRHDYNKLLKNNEIVYFGKKFMEAKIKIVWRQTADKIRATLISDEWFANTLQAGVIREKYINKLNCYYILAIINSKYLNFLYRQKVMETGKVFPQVKLKYLKDLPFVIGSDEQIKNISELAAKIIELQKEFHNLSENSEKWHQLKSEIEKTDKKIDAEVYELYGLTEEEIKIVEGNIKN